MSLLKNRNIVVFGISADTIASHQAFAKSERLNFALLADTNKQVTRTYGVLGPTGLPNRVSFIIGPDGTVRGIDGSVDRQFSGSVGNARISQHGENIALLLSDWKAEVGAAVPNFFLPNYDGATVSARSYGDKAVVIAFLSARDPGSHAAAQTLRILATNLLYKEVRFLAVDPNFDESADEIGAFVKSSGLPFPVARDAYNEVAGHFAVRETPSVWVLNAGGVVVYQGALEESIGVTTTRGPANLVKESLDALLSGRPVPVTRTAVKGSAVRSARVTLR